MMGIKFASGGSSHRTRDMRRTAIRSPVCLYQALGSAFRSDREYF